MWQAVTYGNGLFVAVGSGGAVMTSPDGLRWTRRTAAAANSWQGVAWDGQKFVAVSSNGTNRVMYSSDGFTWENGAVDGFSDMHDCEWRDVTYGNGWFVAVARLGPDRAMYSSNGTYWNKGSLANYHYSVAYRREGPLRCCRLCRTWSGLLV